MYSFLFTAGPDLSRVLRDLKRAGGMISEVMPVREALHATFETFDQWKAGWVVIGPAENTTRPYVTTFVDHQVAVIAFGTPTDGSAQPMAEIIAKEWKVTGTAGVHLLDNSFSTVILDLQKGNLSFLTDQKGLRALEYHVHDDCIWLSPHDISVVAGSGCNITLNDLAVYSVLRTGWSLRGIPLLASLSSTESSSWYAWNDGRLTRHVNYVLTDKNRLQKGDTKGIDRLCDEIISHLHDLTARIVHGHSLVEVDLTAGWDTRAVAAILLHHRQGRAIHGYTSGTTADLEYQTARWFADHYGIIHHRLPPTPCPEELWEERHSAHAFYTNGQGSSWRGFGISTLQRDPAVPHFTGHNAGIFKGLYYPTALKEHHALQRNPDARKVLLDSVPRLNPLIKQNDFEHALLEFLSAIVDEYALISSDAYDILDLFASYERIGKFSPIDCNLKFPTVTNRYCLYENPAVTRMVFRMPSPLYQGFLVQRTILKRYARRSYYKLLNGRMFAPAVSNRATEVVAKGVLEVVNRFNKLMPARQPSPDDKAAKETITKNLLRYTRATILEMDQALLKTIAKETLLKHVEGLVHPDTAQKAFCGSLIGLQKWYGMIQQAKTLADTQAEKINA